MNDTTNKGANVMTEKTKIHKYVSLSMLDDLVQAYTINDRQASEQLGYSKGAAADWRRKDQMPFVASLAAEGLIRRSGNSSAEQKLKSTLKTVKAMLLIVAQNADDEVRSFMLRTIDELIDKVAPVTRDGS